MMKIEKSIYEGYLWYSDKQNPEVLRNEEFEFEITNSKNPFVIEGQLYDSDKMKSISIKFVDGEYIYKEYDVKSTDFNRNDVEKKVFHSNRMEGLKMRFLQYWRESESELCEGMRTLLPAELVFVGFVK